MNIPESVSLRLKETTFSARYQSETRKRLFREPVEYLTFNLVATIGDREVVFESSDVTAEALNRIYEFPQRLIIGDGPFFTGLDFPGSHISELAHEYNIAEGSLIIIDGDRVLATVHGDEIPALQSWLRKVTSVL